MTVLDLVRAKEHEGYRLTRIAETAQVPYDRLWHALRSGKHLHPSELERLQRALDPVGRQLTTAS